MYMTYTITEFRQNTRQILNALDNGKEVTIKRFDTYYQILPIEAKPTQEPSKGPIQVRTPEDVSRALKTVTEPLKTSSMKFCPNSHPIPVGRSRCLGGNEGCKYA